MGDGNSKKWKFKTKKPTPEPGWNLILNCSNNSWMPHGESSMKSLAAFPEEAPIPEHDAREKFQGPSFKIRLTWWRILFHHCRLEEAHWRLEFEISLELEIWNLGFP